MQDIWTGRDKYNSKYHDDKLAAVILGCFALLITIFASDIRVQVRQALLKVNTWLNPSQYTCKFLSWEHIRREYSQTNRMHCHGYGGASQCSACQGTQRCHGGVVSCWIYTIAQVFNAAWGTKLMTVPKPRELDTNQSFTETKVVIAYLLCTISRQAMTPGGCLIVENTFKSTSVTMGWLSAIWGAQAVRQI